MAGYQSDLWRYGEEMIELTDRETLIQILNEYGLRLQKSLGQHFLINKKDLEKIVEAGEITSDDVILEIGTGVGVLTQELCQRAGRVIAYEMDEKPAKVVREKILPNFNNLELIVGDFLKEKMAVDGNFIVVANLPYQITTPVIRRFLEHGPLPSRMAILIQKEVAERLAAQPGSAKRGWVTVLVQLFGEPRIFHIVKPSSFLPEPEVDSAVLIIDNISEPLGLDLKLCLRLVKAGFSSKRRQLPNSLSGGLGIDVQAAREILEKAGVDPKLRAEDLTTEDWKKLTEIFEGIQNK